MNPVLESLAKIGLVPVVKITDLETAVPLAKALVKGGIPCAEVTFRTALAADAMTRIHAEVPELLLGAGTVTSIEQVDRAVEAGASFIVSPGLNPDVVRHCQSRGVPIIPGVCTPTELEQAMALGLTEVKFFPAENNGGVKTIRAISAAYPNIRFMPTGGVNLKNLNDYLAFSKILACGGSWLTPADAIAAGNFDEITRLAAQAVETMHTPEDAPVPAAAKPAEGTRVVTFGEIMLRLAPEGYTRFIQATSYGATYGGGEANVSVSLANYGLDTAFVTRLPAHDIGQAAVNELRRYGVDTSKIVRGGDRVGIYYLEKGASQRPSKVIYDRAHSAIATASREDFDWDAIFDGAAWFHFTGITPALGDNVADICLDACRAAKRLGLTVSCDLNYRKNLWTREKAGQVMGKLMQYVDVCISNEEDAADVFGIRAAHTDVTGGKLDHAAYQEVAQRLTERFSFRSVAITLRTSLSANDNVWAAMLYDGGEYHFSKSYPIHIVDRVGGGDSFGAGLIYGMLKGMDAQSTLEFAVAASCLKHSIEGDFNHVSVAEVERLAGGDASGRVQR